MNYPTPYGTNFNTMSNTPRKTNGPKNIGIIDRLNKIKRKKNDLDCASSCSQNSLDIDNDSVSKIMKDTSTK